jgi:hypothetical protein
MDHLVTIHSTLKELIKESMNMPAEDIQLKGILDQLTILEEEIKEAIKSVEELMNKSKSSKVKSVLKRLNGEIIIGRYRLVISPNSPDKVLLVDLVRILGGPIAWPEAFEEMDLAKVVEVFKDAENIEWNGKIFNGWEQLDLYCQKTLRLKL